MPMRPFTWIPRRCSWTRLSPQPFSSWLVVGGPLGKVKNARCSSWSFGSGRTRGGAVAAPAVGRGGGGGRAFGEGEERAVQLVVVRDRAQRAGSKDARQFRH